MIPCLVSKKVYYHKYAIMHRDAICLNYRAFHNVMLNTDKCLVWKITSVAIQAIVMAIKVS